MSAIIKGKIRGCTNGLIGQKVEYRARFVSDEQPEQELLIPITGQQWHDLKLGVPVELIVEIKV